ncbi:NERD domain-containing protein [Cytobacillus horneckiae]|uniref:NERD domain-containing protein n=1 Tax=Cytobacillus horneckiae TaxID=549687 RepID=A0A2N0ZGQ0_9BACI|nr:NERD domain-containing protein [Cytobacillus horneckiae]
MENEQLKQISADVIIISGLTFKISNTLIQIDYLCIFQKKIVVYEVKYFEARKMVILKSKKNGCILQKLPMIHCYYFKQKIFEYSSL